MSEADWFPHDPNCIDVKNCLTKAQLQHIHKTTEKKNWRNYERSCAAHNWLRDHEDDIVYYLEKFGPEKSTKNI